MVALEHLVVRHKCRYVMERRQRSRRGGGAGEVRCDRQCVEKGCGCFLERFSNVATAWKRPGRINSISASRSFKRIHFCGSNMCLYLGISKMPNKVVFIFSQRRSGIKLTVEQGVVSQHSATHSRCFSGRKWLDLSPC